MEKIFVAIASYRDQECQWTVKDLLLAARHPERVFVGICWQYDSQKDQECFRVPYPFPDQVRVEHVELAKTKGACWAKTQAIKLAEDEDYILLIDSHMRFAQDWDAGMVDALKRTDNVKSFLSTYPAGYEPPDTRQFSTPRLSPVKFNHRIPSQNSVLLNMKFPIPSYLVAGGYLFGRKKMFDQVPYDPHIYFHGEEISYAARLFTHGWDGYTPDKCLIHHFYTRKGASRHWGDDKEGWNALDQRSYKRVRHLLKIERTSDAEALRDIDAYGLGTERSLEEFQKRIGVNFNAQLLDRTRYLTLEAATQALKAPTMPRAQHSAAAMEVCATKQGQMLVPRGDQYIGKSLLHYGEWTEGLNRYFETLVSAGDFVVEVGAAYGAHTLPLSRLAGSEGCVVAVEQSRRHVDLLHANAVLNGMDNIKVVHARCGAMESVVEVFEPNYSGEGNFGVLGHRSPPQSERVVSVIRIDTQAWGRIGLIFIDVPGGATPVLAGARQTIASHRPIVVLNADVDQDADEAMRFLAVHHYSLWWAFVPFFNPSNHFGNTENHFGGLESACLIGIHGNLDISGLGAIRAIGSAANRLFARQVWERVTPRTTA